MVLGRLASSLGRVGATAASRIGSSPVAAGGAGAAGGVLLDDVPIIGGLDPTEGGGGISTTTIVLGIAAIAAVAYAADAFGGGS